MSCHTGWSANIRRTRHTGDFRADGEEHDTYQQAFKRVLRDLKQTPGCNPSAASHMAVSRRPAVVDER
jgi:hypothetical protein